MNANEVNAIIDNVCSKIGLGLESTKDFIPMLSKYMILHSILWATVFLLLSVITFFGIKYLLKKIKDVTDWNKDVWYMGIGFFVVVNFVFVMLTLTYIYTVIEWCSAPEVMTVKYILSIIGK